MTPIPQDLVEKVARSIMAGMDYPESPDTPCSRMQADGTWKVEGPLWRVDFADGARAAIQTLIDEGWKGPEGKT
jgi:hypothetical protein